MGAEGGHDEFMIGALGKAGDGDRTDDAGRRDVERKGTAMGRVVGGRQAEFIGQAGVIFL